MNQLPLPSFHVLSAVCLLLAAFIVVPWLANALAATTDVSVSSGPGTAFAVVEGTRLDVPPDKLRARDGRPLEFSASQTTSLEGPSSSLYWQAAWAGPFAFLGKMGEWLQTLRPAARWGHVGASKGQAGDAYTSRYRLKGGRTPATITLTPLNPSDPKMAFVIRGERRTIAWWRVEGGQPVEQLASGTYRPTFTMALGDLASETLLLAAWALFLALLCWLVGVLVRLVRSRGRIPATDDGRWTMDDGGNDTGSSTPIVHRPSSIVRSPIVHRPSSIVSSRMVALSLFLAATLVSAAACLLVLDGIPHVQDDVAYIFQGRIFALGRSSAPTPPLPEFFQNGFIEMFEGRWFAKYPPGYPLLLAPALLAGVPWLVNALSAGVALALIYSAGRHMYGPHVAAWAALLGVLSPWLIFMSGSYMSHPTTMMWVAVVLYSLVRAVGPAPMPNQGQTHNSKLKISNSTFALLAGFAMGMAFITREWTALGIAAGIAIWALGDLALSARARRPAKFKTYLLVVLGALPPLLFLLYENRQLTGDWLRLAQDLVGSYDRPGFGPGHGDALGHTPALGLYNALVYLRTLATVFDGWPSPLALAPLLLGLVAWVREKDRQRLAWDALLWLGALGLFGAYYAWWSSTTIFGPRYWYEAMPFLLLIAGRGLDLLGRHSSRALSGPPLMSKQSAAGSKQEEPTCSLHRWAVPGVVCALLSLYNLTQTMPAQASSYRDYNDISATALRNAQAAGLHHALLFVELDPAKPNRDYGKVFFANDPLLIGNIIYARDLGAEKNKALALQFPDRRPYWLPLDGPPSEGLARPFARLGHPGRWDR